ncbi:recombinase family protein [Maricaulis sp.]|uniref:recombinase family protein n=1 Tax=Maricaulis sp. TaxID=1486257 RepID=UPI00261F6D6D|nr:recombinase family protein [Maricaulis sp.]
MGNYYAYIRVSTVKQGHKGVSLQEQRSAIQQYADRRQLTVTEWFEERQTAAKQGRPVFGQMLKQLRRKKAEGVILHRVDRGTRNFRDWADLGELTELGVKLYFANEDIDFSSRSGRLTADILVAFAADTIRNLREETKKGFYGRLKQGLYPLPAPVGYLNQGGGKPKAVDPLRGPLVREAFDLYATGQYSITTLREKITAMGLRSASGKPLSVSMIGRMLNNPFYAGIMRVQKTGEAFKGIHEPLISPHQFKRVQSILQGKSGEKLRRHRFCYKRRLRCKRCEGYLIGELQKGRVYYRCRTRGCSGCCIREDMVDGQIQAVLSTIQISKAEAKALIAAHQDLKNDFRAQETENRKKISLRIQQLKQRLERLTDLLIDGTISDEVYRSRQENLLMQIAEAEHESSNIGATRGENRDRVRKMCELAQSPRLSHFSANAPESLELLNETCANFWVDGKKLSVELHFAYELLAKRTSIPTGCPMSAIIRTLTWWFAQGAHDHAKTTEMKRH